MDILNLDECFRVAEEIAREVGPVIREAFYQDKLIETKESIADLVTETDKKVEQMIIAKFKTHFPTHSFIGEESTAAGVKNELTDNPTWVVDPIDGTTNFVHRFPYTAVSIGLLVNKEAALGVIYNPILEHMYTARPGQGAHCNGKKLQCTKTTDLGHALLCAEFGSSRDPAQLDSKFRTMRNIINKAHGLRSLGSAAMSMAMVASGSIDGYYEAGIHAWDIAAGELLVREAGGVVMDTADGNENKVDISIVGTNGKFFLVNAHGVLRRMGAATEIPGGPLDLMSRRVLCAGTEQLAKQVSDNIEQLELERD